MKSFIGMVAVLLLAGSCMMQNSSGGPTPAPEAVEAYGAGIAHISTDQYHGNWYRTLTVGPITTSALAPNAHYRLCLAVISDQDPTAPPTPAEYIDIYTDDGGVADPAGPYVLQGDSSGLGDWTIPDCNSAYQYNVTLERITTTGATNIWSLGWTTVYV